MTRLVEYLCIAYLTGSCFTAFAIYFGLRAIAGAILRKRFDVFHYIETEIRQRLTK